ncbi:MAG: recombination protein O N-terminal domain-containing protein [Parcubacteria group bacterium]
MRLEAIVLKKIPIKEHDEMVICYTKDQGKQTYRAKSVVLPTSKQGQHLDVLNRIEFSLVQGNGHPIIASAYAIDTYRFLKQSLPAMSVTYFFLECFDKLVFDNELDEALWEFLSEHIERSNTLCRQSETNWKNVMKQDYERFMEVMGYDSNTNIHELYHADFSSLQFVNTMLN